MSPAIRTTDVLLKLLALFTIVPLVELALLIPLGMHIGLWPTIGLVVGTALLGAILAKLEGARALANIKRDLAAGKLPADSILDGLAILIAGVFLVTPGVLTDVVAILLLIPPVRAPVRAIAKKRFQKMLADDSISFLSSASMGDDLFGFGEGAGATYHSSTFGGTDAQGDVIDVTPEPEDHRETPTGESTDPGQLSR